MWRGGHSGVVEGGRRDSHPSILACTRTRGEGGGGSLPGGYRRKESEGILSRSAKRPGPARPVGRHRTATRAYPGRRSVDPTPAVSRRGRAGAPAQGRNSREGTVESTCSRDIAGNSSCRVQAGGGRTHPVLPIVAILAHPPGWGREQHPMAAVVPARVGMDPPVVLVRVQGAYPLIRPRRVNHHHLLPPLRPSWRRLARGRHGTGRQPVAASAHGIDWHVAADDAAF